MIVIDASTVISWVLDDETSSDANAALEIAATHGACAPPSFITEVAHALLGAERRGRIDEVGTGLALTEILALPIAVENPDPHTILALARTHRLTCYDAAYLALALRVQLPLATIDRALATAAAAEKVLHAPSRQRKRS
jgi:predicted nucleic acid-binding protein